MVHHLSGVSTLGAGIGQDAAVKVLGTSLLAALTMTIGLVVATPGAAVAAPVPARLSLSPDMAIPGESVTFSGTLPPRKRRPVVVQSYGIFGWSSVAWGRTTTSGAFSISAPALQTPAWTRYRVYARAVRIAGRKYPAAVTPVQALATTQQEGSISVPDHTQGSAAFTISSLFYPARPGRQVTLQVSVNGVWTTVQTGSQDASGKTSWWVSSSGNYRAVAAAARGAGGSLAGPRSVREMPPEEVWLTTDPCREVVFVGARGSDQKQQDFNGLGGEVSGGWGYYSGALHNVNAGFYAVVYPAVAASPAQAVPAYERLFADSIDSGVRDTLNFLRIRAAKCGVDEHYVLSGFSQGAMVMHRTLFALAQSGSATDQAILSRIDGVLAIADGDKVAAQGGHTYGTADPHDAYGISWLAPGASSPGDFDAVDQPLPGTSTWPNTRFHDVCLRGDLICDYGTAVMWTGLDTGLDLHSNAYRAQGAGQFAKQGLGQVQEAATDIAADTQARTSAPPDVGPPPIINFDESTACTQPTITLDNTLGKVPYSFGIYQLNVDFERASGVGQTPGSTAVDHGGTGTYHGPNLVGGPNGKPVRVSVDYFYYRNDVSPDSTNGHMTSVTVNCPG